jgi:Leucine-rich repeat (LRR) protein
MKELKVLALAGNKLTRLPDLTNLSNSLEELYLEENQILVVDGITPMLALKILNLASNRLTTFPDLRNSSSTLEELYLYNDNITSYPQELLKPLVALKLLHLGDASGEQFVTLPNVCVMGSARTRLTIK